TAICTPQSAIPWWLASLLCVAGGLLTKWTAPAFFYGTVIPLLWWRGRLRLLLGKHHLVAAGLAGGICLAWIAAAVWQTGWDGFSDPVTREAVQRVSPRHPQERMQAKPADPPPKGAGWARDLLHPVVFFGIELPWSPGALVSLR